MTVLIWACVVFLFILYICLSLLTDALRFGSRGFLQMELKKKYIDSEDLETHKKRMESYFVDDGKNLRELEWASTILLFLGLLVFMRAFAAVDDSGNIAIREVNDLVTFFAVLIFCVASFLARVFSEPFAEGILIKLYPLWKMVHLLAMPISKVLVGLQIIVLRMIGQAIEEEEEEKEQKLLDSMEDGKEAGVFGDSEREMIENLIEFKDRDVGEVMTPRTDMVAVNVDADLGEVVEKMKAESLSRIIVFEENRDNIIGFVHVRDLLPYWNESKNCPSLHQLVHKPYFVPESKKIRSLFEEFKNQHQHIAVVLDEYGGTAGIVTLEDILEEIVGEIVDEHQDEEESLYTLVNDQELIMNAKLRVTDLNEIFSMTIEESDQYDSVGGLLIALLGRIPVQGEQGELAELGLRYKIISANQRKIERLVFLKNEQKVEA